MLSIESKLRNCETCFSFSKMTFSSLFYMYIVYVSVYNLCLNKKPHKASIFIQIEDCTKENDNNIKEIVSNNKISSQDINMQF